MVVRKRKKVRKLRGSRTMGGGSRKKRRGAGERGGRGVAGLHKHRWSYTLKYMPEHFGKRGFVRPAAVSKEVTAVNVGDLDQNLDGLLQRGLAKFEEGRIIVSAAELGFVKVLGGGRVTRPFDVIAKEFSESAKRKLDAAGGKAIAE